MNTTPFPVVAFFVAGAGRRGQARRSIVRYQASPSCNTLLKLCKICLVGKNRRLKHAVFLLLLAVKPAMASAYQSTTVQKEEREDNRGVGFCNPFHGRRHHDFDHGHEAREDSDGEQNDSVNQW